GRDAMNAPLSAPADVATTSCGAIPRSYSARSIPTSTAPRLAPPARTNATRPRLLMSGHVEDAAGLADHLVGEAPFVVVPGHHLDQRAIDDPGQLEIDDGGTRVANDVGGHERVRGHTQDGLLAARGGLFPKHLVDLGGGGRR